MTMTKATKVANSDPHHHFNQSFINFVSNNDSQTIDKNKVKFKDWSSMKQHVKNNPIKWGSKFSYRRASETGYLYQLDLYFGKKEAQK